MIHKCRVTKLFMYDKLYWMTECSVYDCFLRKAFLLSSTWEEAMLEALHHRMRNL